MHDIKQDLILLLCSNNTYRCYDSKIEGVYFVQMDEILNKIKKEYYSAAKIARTFTKKNPYGNMTVAALTDEITRLKESYGEYKKTARISTDL